MNFLDELLAEVEEKQALHKLEMDRLKADQLLQLAEKLEDEIAGVNKLADDEVALIESYRQSETERLQRKLGYITFQLEQFMRGTGERTLRLVRGELKLRAGRDRVIIENEEAFLKVAGRLGLLRAIPPTSKPDLAATLSYVKRFGHVPDGVSYVPSQERFSFKLNSSKGEPSNGDE